MRQTMTLLVHAEPCTPSDFPVVSDSVGAVPNESARLTEVLNKSLKLSLTRFPLGWVRQTYKRFVVL
jgi:hypothetical protein